MRSQDEMQLKINPLFLVILLGIAASLDGCAETAQAHQSPHPKSDEKPKLERVSNRPGNTKGAVFVVMYHHFRKGRGELYRTPAEFRADLELFYKSGFRPVLASEYLTDNMPLPPGASPIVITFDDSNPTQLKLLKDGSVDPNCGVGVWQKFAETHPDFPVHGTFFVLPDVMWRQPKFRQKKIDLIFSLGSELASHTMTHPTLSRISDQRVKKELGNANIELEAIGQKPPISLAVPYGVFPRHTALLKGFSWKGKEIKFSGVFMAWGSPARSTTDPKFNRYKIPRMAGISKQDGVGYWIKQVKRGKVKPYVEP